jgi:hypothetical protein
MFKKQLENKFNSLVQTMPDTNGQPSTFELEFVSNFQVTKKKRTPNHTMLVSLSRLFKQV